MKCNVQSCFFSHLSKIKNVSKTDFWVKLYFQLTFVLKISPLSLKWRIFSRTGKIGSGKNTKYIFFSYWAWGHVLSLKPIWQLKQEAVIYNNLNFCPLCFKGWSCQCTAVATKRICWNKFFYIIRKRGIQQLRGPNITQFWPPTHLGWTIVVYIISMLCSCDQVWTFYWPTHSRWSLVGERVSSPGLENAVKRWPAQVGL